MNFETSLRQAIESTPHRRLAGRAVLRVLDMNQGPRRARILARMEAHAAAHAVATGAATGPMEGIDWANIDWAAFFDKLIKLLTLILPLFM